MFSWLGNEQAATWCWAVPSVVVGAWLTFSIIRDLLHREAGVDLIAVLAIVGALLLGEALAAAVIGVMLATGEWLERYAAGRANRELSALVSRAPRIVHRYVEGGIEDRGIVDVAVGDRLLVKPGEVVPVDGTVIGDPAVLDEAALTGESRLATREAGDPVSSGTVNAGAPFDLLATATAEHSTYAGIVRLVEEAQSSKAPFVRMADRYAILFVPLTLVIAGIAWAISGDPVRALAVLVVATPCPLLLAAPIAIVSGISRSAKRGIIVKGGGALEALARARVMLFDKTGTLTAGRPRLAEVVTAPGRTPDEVLALAASLEQVSPHVLAASIVSGARERGVVLQLPDGATEVPGAGISGAVGGVEGAGRDGRVRERRRPTATLGPRRAATRQPGGCHECLRGCGRRARRRARAGRPPPTGDATGHPLPAAGGRAACRHGDGRPLRRGGPGGGSHRRGRGAGRADAG